MIIDLMVVLTVGAVFDNQKDHLLGRNHLKASLLWPCILFKYFTLCHIYFAAPVMTVMTVMDVFFSFCNIVLV